MNATASGRVFFEGDSAQPPAAAGGRVPMFASEGQTCRYGSPTVGSDWSFRIDGLAGTCRSADYYLIAVDDIEYKATVDTAVLEKLARNATRVMIPERDLIEVSLQRHLLSDAIK